MATLIISAVANLSQKILSFFSSVPSSSSTAGSSQQSESIKEITTLDRTVRGIRAVLGDAEQKEIRDETVKFWLSELKQVAYDAKDILLDFYYEIQLTKLEHETNDDTSKKRKFGDNNPPKSLLLKDSIIEELLPRVQEVRQQLNDISRDRERFSLREEDGLRVFPGNARLGTSSLMESSEIFGRDEEKEEIIEALLGLSTPCTGSCLEIISIVSMGGMGKTTLARLVYNDERVRSNFPLRSWAWVSRLFDGIELTKAIIESFTGAPCNLTCLESLQYKLQEVLKDRKFLLVLDDIWNEDPIIWDTIKQPFLSGANGSRIIITTRNEKVADIIGTKVTLRLGGLPPTASWKLFHRLAFRGCLSETATRNIVEICHKIVKKTNGVPLVLRILGGLLGSEITLEFWSYVLSTDLWDLNEGKILMMPILKLSNYHLPSYLKPCFEYCSLFPRGHIFEMNKLVKLWDALGFIQADDTKKLEVGFMYVDDLIMRSIFQNPEYVGSMKFFTMHDLIYDLGKSLWQEEYTMVESDEYNIKVLLVI